MRPLPTRRGWAVAPVLLLYTFLGVDGVGAAQACAPRVVADQVQSQFAGGLSVRVQAYQQVRAARRGPLVRVDVPLCTVIRGSTIRITATDNKASGTRTVSRTVTFRRSLSDCVWYRFAFLHPFSQRVGDRIVIALSARHGEAPLWGAAAFADHNPYRRGSAVWMGRTVNDFAFRTFVDTSAGQGCRA